MKVLVLYSLDRFSLRDTVKSHLNSFKEHKSLNCLYVNIKSQIPAFLQGLDFDLIILHYTLLAGVRFHIDSRKWLHKVKAIKNLNGFKVAIPQDEYLQSERLLNLFKESEVQLICTTLIEKQDISNVYLKHEDYQPKVIKVLTGYLSKKLVEENEDAPELKNRPIDVSYRARRIPFYCGEHGDLKFKLLTFFTNYFKSTDFLIDIKNTDDRTKRKNAVLDGKAWFKFLKSSKSVIGCEGGSSLWDSEGGIQLKIKEFIKRKTDPDFENVKANCFPDEDFNIHNFALGPRNLEAVATKTLQILVEGYFNGILIPWKHYLPLKKDFSNAHEIISYLNDTPFCQKIVDTAYEDITNNKDLSYQSFVDRILKECIDSSEFSLRAKSKISYLLRLRVSLTNFLLLCGGQFKQLTKKFLSNFINVYKLKEILKLNNI
tara:strand:+ start:9854 stop:11146 length:1293 start_codon:yes stop_codon:yes gene_type:complete